MKYVNKCKRKGKNVLPALAKKNLAKRTEENDKKSWLESWLIGQREKEFENFLKKCLNTWESSVLKKLFIQFSIDRKLGSIDRKCFNWWSSINWVSIEADRGWPKFLIAISIDRKISLIHRNFGKNKFLKKQSNFV